MHSTYRNIIHTTVKHAVDKAVACSSVSHAGLKGALREIVLADLLRPLLPSDLGIGTGTIISHDGGTSSQHDIIIYDRSILPPIVFNNDAGLFPIEAVAYAIEVKSTLDAAELKSAHDAAAALLAFPYTSGLQDHNDDPLPHDLIKVISGVFAFATDLSASNDLDRYQRLLQGSPPALKSICVVGGGFWDHRRSVGWTCYPPDHLDEIVQFVAQVGNSYRRVLDSRGKPRIGYYLR